MWGTVDHAVRDCGSNKQYLLGYSCLWGLDKHEEYVAIRRQLAIIARVELPYLLANALTHVTLI
jgi:hypothetical protein